MKYKNQNTAEIKEYQTLKSENKNVSLPKAGTNVIMGEWQVISETPQPTYDTLTEGIREVAPIGYVQTWEVYDLPQAEKDAIKAKKDKEKEDAEWSQYKIDKEADEKAAWIASGKPKYKG